eukprot:scaffold2588_cov51-Phaeocystis_antarctica.AAC.2
MAVTRFFSVYMFAAPSAAHPQLALPPAWRSLPASTPHSCLAGPSLTGLPRRHPPCQTPPPVLNVSRGRDIEGRPNPADDVRELEGVVPDRHERGRLREVQAREFGVCEGGIPDRLDLGRDHERARDVGLSEGPVSDRHERGRLREVQAREFGQVEGGTPDRLDVGRDHERARDVGVAEGVVPDRLERGRLR